MISAKPCEHAKVIRPITALASGCQACMALGAAWNELRVCLTCGHVGCCEDSNYAHALQHFRSTGHPLIAPLARGETWAWCYVDRRYFELSQRLKPKRRSVFAKARARLFGRDK
jgi:uncharacterized UBP type Zn finger protein